jgi:DNA polymerase-1
MVDLQQALADTGSGSRLILQVHDELVLEVPEKELDEVTDMVREEMVGAIELDVPLVVDIGSGPNWMEAKP